MLGLGHCILRSDILGPYLGCSGMPVWWLGHSVPVRLPLRSGQDPRDGKGGCDLRVSRMPRELVRVLLLAWNVQ